MSLLAPFAAALLLLLPILIAFYLLKVRRQDYEVGSTLLWRHLTRDVTAHEPWQRLRWNPLLLLQALIMLALIAALARPYLARAGTATGFEVIVLDGSASMTATDVAPSRFEAAKAAARGLLGRLPAGAAAALIETGASPRTLNGGSADRATLEAALAAARPSISETDMRSALELALGLARSHRDGRIDVISDGAFDDLSDFGAAGVPIHFVTVGGEGQNEAITALSARPQPLAPDRVAVFVRVDNDSAKTANNLLTLAVDGHALESKPVTAAAGASQDFVFDSVPAGAHTVEASLRDKDDLAADNQAFLVLQQRPPPRVLLVSSGNRFLLTALRFLPLQLFQVPPNQLGAVNADSYDIVILDGLVPPILPKGNLLLIGPPNSPLLPVSGNAGPLAVTSSDASDPLLRDVDLSGLQVRSAGKVAAPGWARVLADGNGTPLLLAGETQGHRMVILPFSLQQSNLPLLPALPILLANALDGLAPADQAGVSQAVKGSLLVIQPLPTVDRVEILRPDHSTVTLTPANGRSLAYDNTDEAGMYTVTQRAGTRVLAQQLFPVNLLSPRESNIKALPPPLLGGVAPAAPVGRAGVAPYELLPLLAALAALLLLGEWWWYHRRA